MSTPKILAHIASDCTVAMFKDYNLSIAPAPRERTARRLSFGAVVGFTGPAIIGSVMLGMSEGAITRSRRTGKERPGDWVAELANQLLGRIKNRLLGHAVEIYMTPPLAIRGDRLRVVNGPEGSPLRFDAEADTILVWFDHELRKPISLDGEPAPLPGNEGDIIIF